MCERTWAFPVSGKEIWIFFRSSRCSSGQLYSTGQLPTPKPNPSLVTPKATKKLRAKPIVTETETKFKPIVTTPKPKVWTSCYILCNMLGKELESSL